MSDEDVEIVAPPAAAEADVSAKSSEDEMELKRSAKGVPRKSAPITTDSWTKDEMKEIKKAMKNVLGEQYWRTVKFWPRD